MSIFEKAARQKVRFQHNGTITTEDLWDLSLVSLDNIYKNLKAQQNNAVEGLLTVKTKADELLDLKLAVVAHVFSEKMHAKKAKEAAAELAERNKKILGIIADKQDESLRSMSVEDLKKLVTDAS